MYNSVNLTGRLAKDPYIDAKGERFAYITLAVAGVWDKDNKTETTEFIPVLLGPRNIPFAKLLKKGDAVMCLGKLRRKKDKDGKPSDDIFVSGDRLIGLGKAAKQDFEPQDIPFN